MASVSSFPVDDLACLKRFLCVSSDFSSGLVECISRLVETGKGEEVVKILVDFRSVANKKLVMSLLASCTSRDLKTKQAAYAALNDVCDAPPLLFQFLTCMAKQTAKGKSGFGRAKRKAIAKWYNGRSLKDLAVFVTRYRKRSSWSHVDLIRLAHTKPGNIGVDFILKYVTKGLATAKQHLTNDVPDDLQEVVRYLDGVETAKHSKDEHQVACLVEQFKLTQEHVPTWFMKGSKEVWLALIPNMSLSGVLSHLNKLASVGVLDPGPRGSSDVLIRHLGSDALLKEEVIHPFNIQIAVKSYEGGKTGRATSLWTPNPEVSKALHSVFYKAVDLYHPTNAKYLLAIDVGTSMFGNPYGAPLLMSSLWAAASLSIGIIRSEGIRHVLAVAGAAIPLDVAGHDITIEQICGCLEKHRRDGSSSLSQSIEWASEKKEEVDLFVVFTDQTRSAEQGKLVEAFRKYRTNMKRPSARLAVVSFSKILDQAADVEDSGILFLKGLNPAVPEIIHRFVMGKLDSGVAG